MFMQYLYKAENRSNTYFLAKEINMTEEINLKFRNDTFRELMNIVVPNIYLQTLL